MADARQTRCTAALTAVAAAALLTATGCASDPGAGLLERVCRGAPDTPSISIDGASNCLLGQDAREIAGATVDSYAVHLGPEGGQLSIRLLALPAAYNTRWSLEVLARSRNPNGGALFRQLTWGSCAACPPDPADIELRFEDEFAWGTVALELEGNGTFQTVPNDALIVFSGADIDIADLRDPNWEDDLIRGL
jgi:hypothetical protein